MKILVLGNSPRTQGGQITHSEDHSVKHLVPHYEQTAKVTRHMEQERELGKSSGERVRLAFKGPGPSTQEKKKRLCYFIIHNW